MPSQSNTMIVFDTIKHELTQVKFSKLDNTSDTYKVHLNNTLDAIHVDENGFILRAQRTVTFVPYGAFELLVEFDIICIFNNESKAYYNGNLDSINDFIKKRKVEIFNSLEVGNLMSIIISQITLANNHKSIVTPPYIKA